MSRSYEQAQARAMTSPGYNSTYASASGHARDMWPAPDRRRKCRCGCGGRTTHVGGANAVALMSGCELSVRRWVRGDRPWPYDGAEGRARLTGNLGTAESTATIPKRQEDA